MNNTIIQENSGLSSFYSKVYGFVGMGIAISALVSGLMLTTFQTALVEILLHYSWIYYGAIFIELALVWSASSRGLRNSPAALLSPKRIYHELHCGHVHRRRGLQSICS